ncbi:MAG: mycofactocin-coupled SDR family oxidoreductase [Ilumatobacteraceae bacterium]
MGRVDGKVALVTGGARGQGRAHALRLAEEGADVIVTDICHDLDTVTYPLATADDLAETARMVEAKGRAVVAVPADVRDSAAMDAAVREGVDRLGRLDIVVANAGICTMQHWDAVSDDVWRDTIDINLTGVWNSCRPAIPHLIDRGGGSIVLISSVAGLKGQPFLTPYVAAKHGVVGLMRALANELARHMIRVNSIHPTGVETPMGLGLGHMNDLIADAPELGPIFTNALPITITQPEDIADAVLFLASDESKYVTGLELKIDAGCTLR